MSKYLTLEPIYIYCTIGQTGKPVYSSFRPDDKDGFDTRTVGILQQGIVCEGSILDSEAPLVFLDIEGRFNRVPLKKICINKSRVERINHR